MKTHRDVIGDFLESRYGPFTSESAKAKAAALLDEWLTAAGYVIVPKVPTEDQIDVGAAAINVEADSTAYQQAGAVYANMLAAFGPSNWLRDQLEAAEQEVDSWPDGMKRMTAKEKPANR